MVFYGRQLRHCTFNESGKNERVEHDKDTNTAFPQRGCQPWENTDVRKGEFVPPKFEMVLFMGRREKGQKAKSINPQSIS